ncbi:MAG: hypothetical protein FWG50_02135 [Kiritimatiellaeota bacterium]|nr:hypothetical protein [Kiritimatiellota bacterium]
MKQVWKWIMHLNAKAFCAVAALFFAATLLWCGYLYMTPPEPIKEGEGKLPPPPEQVDIGILDYVARQLAGDDLTVPLDPFLPLMEDILTNQVTRAQLAEWRDARAGGAVAQGGGRGGPGGPGVRPGAGAGGAGGPGEPKMITPKISFQGFVKRTDGSRVAMFSDSSNNLTDFYAPGKTIHGIEILSADMKEALVRYPDGTEEKILVGKSIELPPEPEQTAAPQG